MIFALPKGSTQDCDKVYKYTHPIAFSPQIYISKEITEPILLDGRLDDLSWEKVEFSDDFVDIEGENKPIPERKTKMKMLYDEEFLYIGAILQEDHIWHTLKEKDAIMFHDDDFEVFVDADGDGHNYQEFEMNAYNALWDLWMLYPYHVKRERNYIMDWEPRGVKTAVYLEGSANDPSDIDSFWSVEIAIPLKHLGTKRDFWRINFSRVDWLVEIVDGNYKKVEETPERNWVWSPMGFVNMHKPETWGYLAFQEDFQLPEIEGLKWDMWKLYYAIRAYRSDHGALPLDPKCFIFAESIELHLSPYGFDIVGEKDGETWVLNESAFIRQIK